LKQKKRSRISVQFSNVSSLYNNDVIIYKIKKSRENSFVCKQVYIIFQLQH
jgi:hypothetical protein